MIRQGMVSLGLHVAGLLSVTMAAFLIFVPAGFAVFGISCFALEWATREEGRR